MSHTPIIILSATEWRDNPVSTMHIAAHLSKTRKVVFVETPGRRMPKLSELPRVLGRIKRFLKGAQSQADRGLKQENVNILSPIAIPIPGNALIRKINTVLLSRQLKKTFKKLGISKPILWAFSPYWLPITKKLPHEKLIFHCVDALHTYDNSMHFQNAFNNIAKKADAVFTPGVLIFENLKTLNSNVHLIGHGCSDLHLAFKKQDEPSELKSVPRPIAVYAGCLANWVDYDLLYQSASSLQDISFVLLGYIHSLAPEDKIKKLLSLKNVYSFGYTNYDRLPAFYHEAAVGIIPYQADNEHIHYCTPTKMLDYFAAGLPCVTTRYPAAEKMSGYVSIADDSEAFSEAIKKHLQTSAEDKTKRYNYAKMHSWPEQIAKMLNAAGVQ